MHRPGIEPGPPAWQASILPLNQRCFDVIVTLLATSNIKSSSNNNQNLTISRRLNSKWSSEEHKTNHYERREELRRLLPLTLLLLSGPAIISVSLASGGSALAGRRVIMFTFCVVVPLFIINKDQRLVG